MHSVGGWYSLGACSEGRAQGWCLVCDVGVVPTMNAFLLKKVCPTCRSDTCCHWESGSMCEEEEGANGAPLRLMCVIQCMHHKFIAADINNNLLLASEVARREESDKALAVACLRCW